MDMTNEYIKISLTALLFSLVACTNEVKTADDACARSNKYCEFITEKARCNIEYDTLITNYYKSQEDASNKHYYETLVATDNYLTCSGFEVLREVKLEKVMLRKKINDNVKVIQSKIISQTKQTDDQHILYWRWANLGEEYSQNKLLKMDDNNRVTAPYTLYMLAQYYAKYNQGKALRILNRILPLIPKDNHKVLKSPVSTSVSIENLHINTLRDIAAIHYRIKNYDSAYVYTHILTRFNDTGVNIDLIKSKINSNKTISKLDALSLAKFQRLQNGTDTHPK